MSCTLGYTYLQCLTGERNNEKFVLTFRSSYVSEFGAWCFQAPPLREAFKRQTRSRFSSHSVSLHLRLLFYTEKILRVQLFTKKENVHELRYLKWLVELFCDFESIATYIFLDLQEKLKLIINDTCCIEFSFERVVALQGRPRHACGSLTAAASCPAPPYELHLC